MPARPPRHQAATLRRAREIGLKYVYEGYIPGAGGENTYCPNSCSFPSSATAFMCTPTRDSRCPDCGERIDGVGMSVGT